MMRINVYTIGFAQTPAEEFFTKLLSAGVRKVIDVRLNNTSQLSGFSKKDDLKFFLGRIAQIEYEHLLVLAPTVEMFTEFKNKKDSWEVYQRKFLDLLQDRRIHEVLGPSQFENGCLLCSEREPHFCHRRLVVEYLNRHWNGELSVTHL